jgi:DNA polymerase
MTASGDGGDLVRRRLGLERLFGIEEVYVRDRAGGPEQEPVRREGASGSAAPAAPERGDAREERRRLALEAARERIAARERRSSEGDGRRPAQAAPGSGDAGPQDFVIEEVPGAEEEMSLLSEAECAGIPHVSAEAGPRAERLERLKRWVAECSRCPLAGVRQNVVFGEGDPEAELVFVGEAPGADEDATGRPFVGRAGRLLTKIIKAMGYRREDVYICNVLKCRPPGNRAPAPDEVAHCSPILHEQLAVIAPRAICALGGPATKTLLGLKEGITKLRGRFFRYRGIPLLPTFHPAYLLRNMNEKRRVWEDMKKLVAFLGRRTDG